MKRTISFIMSLALMLTMVATAFASETVKFKVTLVSESDTAAVVTIDYDGGSGFNALDMEITFSSNVSVTEAKKSTGLSSFLVENENAISSSNKNGNSVVTAFASINSFKVVDGKDLYKITLKKNSSAKLTKNDVKVSISNCGLLKSGSTDVELLTTSVSYSGFANVVSTTKTTQKTTAKQTTTTKKGETTTKSAETTTKPGETTSVGETTSAGETTTLTESVAGFTSDYDDEYLDGITEDTEDETDTEKNTDKKKIIIVGAAAICCVIVIAAGVYYVVKKTKKDDFEE